jgi:hypothetical protein
MAEEQMSAEEHEAQLETQIKAFAEAVSGEGYKQVWEPGFPKEARDKVMEGMCKACSNTQIAYIGGTDLDLDTFIEKFINSVPPGVRKMQKLGDSALYYEFDIELFDPKAYKAKLCSCPLVREGIVPPSPEVCKGLLCFERTWAEGILKHPVQVDLLDSPLTTGSGKCRAIIYLRLPVWSSRDKDVWSSHVKDSK